MTENAPGSLAYQDGNLLAGPLAEVFSLDLTTALTTCVGCGRRAPVAMLQVYPGGPGMVARCACCHDVVLRFVRTSTAAYLDLRGTVSLAIPLGGDM